MIRLLKGFPSDISTSKDSSHLAIRLVTAITPKYLSAEEVKLLAQDGFH